MNISAVLSVVVVVLVVVVVPALGFDKLVELCGEYGGEGGGKDGVSALQFARLTPKKRRGLQFKRQLKEN